jgi:hypothetical protein
MKSLPLGGEEKSERSFCHMTQKKFWLLVLATLVVVPLLFLAVGLVLVSDHLDHK